MVISMMSKSDCLYSNLPQTLLYYKVFLCFNKDFNFSANCFLLLMRIALHNRSIVHSHFSLVHYYDTFLPSPSPQEFIRHKLEEEQRQLEILQQQLLQEQALLMVICALFAFFVCFFKQWIMRLSFFQYTTVYYISLVNKSTQKYSLMVSRQLFSKSQLFLSIYNISAGLLIDFISWICRDLIHIFPNVFASTKSLP